MNSQKHNYHILIVDDEPLIRESLYEIFRIEGYQAHMAAGAEEALTTIEQFPIDVILTDLKLSQMNGIQLLQKVKAEHPAIEVILITGYGTIETAVEAMKQGAFDYITKPINDQEMKIVIEKIIERKNILAENENLRNLIAQVRPSSFENMVGASETMQKVYHIIDSVANSNATILISGESGTGKGLAVRAIHARDSQRRNKPFVEISCGALSETLLESELFGHAKGAFTGAIKDKEGRFEMVQGGTIFLDEIDAFSPHLQVKLLRVLQDGVFERVGENLTRKANMRVVVASNRDLPDLVTKGNFREDLYYRINVINIPLPPLRERKEDLDMLTNHFIQKYSQSNNKNICGISDEVRKMFQEYPWPGNIRELENLIEGAVVLCRTDVINKWDIPNVGRFSSNNVQALDGKSLKKVMEDPERQHIISALNEYGWNRNKVAAALGINRTTLYNKMKKYGISLPAQGRNS